MKGFVYNAAPMRVIFGAGEVSRIESELDRLQVKRALILSTPEQAGEAQSLAKKIGDKAVAIFSNATMHTPTDVTEEAMKLVSEIHADGLVSIGGGSTIGLGKAIALRTGLPQLAIPTTYAGSEMTSIIGQTENGVKTTQITPKVLPETVIYDTNFVRTLPDFIAGPSAMNAIAHAVEALYAKDGNPVISLMAEEAIRAIGAALPPIMAPDNGSDSAREDALYGAWLAGACLGSVGMSIHHKICHVLGGSFNLPHAPIHCLMIPYSAAFNAEAAPEAMARVARALGTNDAPSELHRLMRLANKQTSLADFGLTDADLDKAADIAVQKPYWNPRPVTRSAVREMLQSAWNGDVLS